MPEEFRLYRVFGFRVRSAMALPELSVDDGDADAADVALRIGTAPRPEGLTTIIQGIAADARYFWMDIPDVARILVRAGREIVVDPAAGVDPLVIRAYLLGSALGALLHQRGVLPLHASAVEMGGGAVAFMGASGAGKSTIALHLADRGHPPISDDICAVQIDPDGQAWLQPGPRRMKLWEGSLTATGRAPEGLTRVLPTLDKYQLPLGAAIDHAVPLRAVILLQRGDVTEIQRLTGVAAATALMANTFRGEWVAPMIRSRGHFGQCVAIAQHSGVSTLTRRWALDGLGEASDAVERWVSV